MHVPRFPTPESEFIEVGLESTKTECEILMLVLWSLTLEPRSIETRLRPDIGVSRSYSMDPDLALVGLGVGVKDPTQGVLEALT